jgi:hypothetical protein
MTKERKVLTRDLSTLSLGSWLDHERTQQRE